MVRQALSIILLVAVLGAPSCASRRDTTPTAYEQGLLDGGNAVAANVESGHLVLFLTPADPAFSDVPEGVVLQELGE